MCKTTVTVDSKDKKKFKQLVLDYDTDQMLMFRALVKIAKSFKPELKEILK